tara:strand:- start:322 stop:999 length:678 start_codon:yes stop_codon:yes gene_type:complete
MNFLALDTSSVACSVAISKGDEIFSSHKVSAESHSLILIPTIQEALKTSKIKLNDLHAIILGTGPGSFVGTRIGAAVAQGIAFGVDISIVTVSSMEAIALEAMIKQNLKKITVVQDARMDEVFIGKYTLKGDNIETLSPIKIYPIGKEIISTNTHEMTIVGSGSKLYSNQHDNKLIKVLDDNYSLPRAHNLINIGKKLFLKGKSINPEQLIIDYIRNEVASKKKK